MFEKYEIEFKRGTILTSQMLTAIFESQNNAQNILYRDFCDGIIEGLDFITLNQQLFMTPGIIKFGGEIFILKNRINLSKLLNNRHGYDGERIFIAVGNLEECTKHGVKIKRLNVTMDVECSDKKIILGKYLHRDNIGIKTDFDAFEQLTDNNYIDLSLRQISYKGKLTCDLTVARLFAQELIKRQDLNNYDNVVITLALNKIPIDNFILTQLLKSYQKDLQLNNIIQLLESILTLKNEKREKNSAPSTSKKKEIII